MAKILIVDDDRTTTQLLGSILSKEGYKVQSVNESRKTLTAALRFFPDLIILDLMMPGVDGIDTCKALRSAPEFQKTPILFLSALGAIDNKVAAYEAGATDYLTKPVYPVELKLKIKALIDIR